LKVGEGLGIKGLPVDVAEFHAWGLAFEARRFEAADANATLTSQVPNKGGESIAPPTPPPPHTRTFFFPHVRAARPLYTPRGGESGAEHSRLEGCDHHTRKMCALPLLGFR
jgi:hypothetical protein